ncbi:hypothetical protein BDR03DRAFT_591695 [Suillus americanus]|nr:hypothetical protein BDR03DRAFT_591695 [Suillus americanus]
MSPEAAKHLDGYPLSVYLASLIASFVSSALGLLCQELFGPSAMLMELGDNFEEGKQPFVVDRCSVLVHVLLFRMARFLLAYSLGFLAGALSIIVLGAHLFASLTVIATINIFLDTAFMKDQPTLTLLYRPFGCVWFGIFVHYFLQYSILSRIILAIPKWNT